MPSHNTGEMPELKAFLQDIREVIGKENLRDDPAERQVYSYDASVYRGLDAMAVAFPENTAQVSAIMRISCKAGVPVIARGAGTGINGGALPQQPALVLAFSRMNKVVAVDLPNRVATVQPGVVNQDLKAELEARGFGFTYVPDPGSQVVSTIGGNVGNNAGGMHCLKYGVTANHIMGLEMVLPDGEVLRTGGALPGRPGPDLTGLMVGSEGTLGVITQISVRILPLQETVVTQLALFPTLEDAAETVSGIMSAGILPAALEMLDQKAMRLVDKHAHVGYPENAGACLIIEMDGLKDGMESELRRVREICEANDAMEIQTANSQEASQKLWLSRRAAYPAMAQVSPSIYVMDCTVPRNMLAEAIRRVVEITAALGLEVVNVAHAGDGNLHPLIPFDKENPKSKEAALKAHHQIMAMCVSMGGSISGEHGIGVEKQGDIDLMYNEDELTEMFALKRVLDPEDLLNPQKIFPLRYFKALSEGRFSGGRLSVSSQSQSTVKDSSLGEHA